MSTTALAASPAAAAAEWCSLGTPASELRLEFTLPTGQSFRWRQNGDSAIDGAVDGDGGGGASFTGVVGRRAVTLRQRGDDVLWRVVARGQGADPEGDAAALADYFNLSHRLGALTPGWAAACPRYAAVAPHLPGARMLRQDPVECLFQFICSSNNHILRIHGMVERLCRQYGTPLTPLDDSAAAASAAGGAAAGVAPAAPAAAPLSLYAFPTLEQLAAATEEQLRADGFGYRAKFVTGSVAQLMSKPGGGAAWLAGLRGVPYAEASAALQTLPGIGPKVAACVCLFALDKHQAIPVDTHVWALATKYYCPQLRGKANTPRLHGEVQAAFEARFGPYCGWAHNALFISELASMRKVINGGAKRGAASASSDGDSSEAEGDGGDDDPEYVVGGGKAAAAPVLPETPLGAEAPSGAVGSRPRRRAKKAA